MYERNKSLKNPISYAYGSNIFFVVDHCLRRSIVISLRMINSQFQGYSYAPLECTRMLAGNFVRATFFSVSLSLSRVFRGAPCAVTIKNAIMELHENWETCFCPLAFVFLSLLLPLKLFACVRAFGAPLSSEFSPGWIGQYIFPLVIRVLYVYGYTLYARAHTCYSLQNILDLLCDIAQGRIFLYAIV